MNIACPNCRTVYRLDPRKVPGAGVRTRCRECDTSFLVAADAVAQRPGAVADGQPVTQAAARTAPAGGTARGASPAFGPQDPQTRARRVARALVSDIKVYHPDKWEQSRRDGSLRKEFRSEILKSWEEYVEQVGEELAKGTPYFRDALNDILAGGDAVF